MASVALQSKEHKDLLDIIDRLRSKGISRYIDLPEIIVCGEQSAGKSSVLEAISGMSFPTKDNLCTRFATELILRREESLGIKVSITPGPDRSIDERSRLSSVKFDVDAASPDLASVVEKAKDIMGISETKQFSTDTLRVELCGPSQPHLTMIDLPGMFRAGSINQSLEFAPVIRDMVHNFMKRPRSIILAVVSAKSDFAAQEVTELARELDPESTRTLGLITKPDTLDVGSDSEAAYVKLAQNKDVVFRLGWHVLKNRSYQTRTANSAERDKDEESFFSQGVWSSIDPKHLGVNMLRTRLSNVLKGLILHQLPHLLCDVESGISQCRSRLEQLGTPRGTFEEQRRYLLRVSQKFSVLIKAAIDGSYNDPFFRSAKTKDGYKRRLRAVVQNTLTEYAGDMGLYGQTRVIVESLSEGEGSGIEQISREEYTKEVQDLMRKSMGRELPGTFSPLIIGELFREQCQPWEAITLTAKTTIVQSVYHTTLSIINGVAVDETASRILRFINQGIETLDHNLEQKVIELLEPHYNGHPITYNHYLTDNVQKAQSTRRRRGLEKIFTRFFGKAGMNQNVAHALNPMELLEEVEERTEVDMERHASNLAIDYMQAYYKVALKKFIDDFASSAVEQCLIRELPSLFNSEKVDDLTDDEIALLAGESQETSTERTQSEERLSALEVGLHDLRHLHSHHALAFPNLQVKDNEILEEGKGSQREDRRSLSSVSQSTSEHSIDRRDSGSYSPTPSLSAPYPTERASVESNCTDSQAIEVGGTEEKSDVEWGKWGTFRTSSHKKKKGTNL